MSHRGVRITQWLDPRVPISRTKYLVAQLITVMLGGALLDRVDSVLLQGWSAVLIALVLTGAAAVLALMSLLTVKRLLDIGWSRRWALLMLGPVLMYSLLAIGRSNQALIRAVFFPVVLLFVFGAALMAALFVRPGTQGQP
jgi:uncharacterized membrane protein YhaH (DUF805 family)